MKGKDERLLGLPGRRSGSVVRVERFAYCLVHVGTNQHRQQAGQLAVRRLEAVAQGQGLD
jgi:hypothetical protein